MTTTHEPSWPYEQRFELLTSEQLLRLPDAIWEEAARLSGEFIVREGRSPSCRHFILSTASLLVFERRIVLISRAPEGVANAAQFLLHITNQAHPIYAAIEQRHPLGRLARRGYRSYPLPPDFPPPTHESGAASMHTWPLSSNTSSHRTLVILMHDLRGELDLQVAREVIGGHYPELLVSGIQTTPASFSLNAVGNDDYIAVYYCGDQYVSVEASFEKNDAWERTDALLEELMAECNPEIVAPLWHGPSIVEDSPSHADDTATVSEPPA